ncbi:cysteine desulfurase-like protein [Nostocoides jenkinsii]|uniref:Cysteine desulfurase family protein n=1 Tax=Nostocoides jenkinsii Ben 74 TaxID=1193518 RepID=A0A077MFS8_9MICO|nr:cysteine desulfurase-like protein [Tetrasphaera jenkinsii]CCI54113.1 Cysteine desulfurase family protein [Tetrasphaera jenkinsii Ben 74]
MTYDVAAVRAHFPALAEGAAHFDAPGGTQAPRSVGDAVARTLTSAIANRGTITRAERRAEDAVAHCRAALGDLLAADPRGVVVGRSMTDLTYDFARTLAKGWQPGDEVVVTRLDHDANVRPWVQAAEAVGALPRFADFDPTTGELDPGDIAAHLTARTRLVAVTAASNLIGTMPDIAAISSLVHERSGALVYADGVHYTAHETVDLPASGADLWACSPYKFLGPHCGVVVADPALLEQLQPDKLLPSTTEVPERFELGTLPYELMAGVTAAIDFHADLAGTRAGSRRDRLIAAYAAIHRHERHLRTLLEETLRDLPGVTVYSNAQRRTPTLLFTVAGWDSQALRAELATREINAPAGNFYAIECSRHLGLGDAGGVRVGLAPYTDEDDIGRLLDALRDLLL